MRRGIRLVLLSGIALALSLGLEAPRVAAHGTQDQAMAGDPGCVAGVMKGRASSTLTPRQEFVPQAGDIRAIEVCLELTEPTTFISPRILTGTATSPGSVVTELAAPYAVPGPGFVYAHIELPVANLTAGTTYVLEIRQGSLTPFFWRGSCGAPGGACTGVEDFYPAGGTNVGADVGDFGFRTFEATDPDLDGLPEANDNCPFDYNPGQENADSNIINLAPYGKAFNDHTRPNSDELGDACDSDDDNDGIPDSVELSGPCGAPTDPLKLDTDGDLVNDYAECALGFDPNDPNSTPPASYPAGEAPNEDFDRDGLTNSFETTVLGTNWQLADTDGDGVLDGREFKNFGTSPLLSDTDGDACSDAKEVASVNGDRSVSAIDLSQVAQHFFARLNPPPSAPVYIPSFDVTQDGTISALDLSQVAQNFGQCV